VQGEPFVMKAPAACRCQFDVKHDHWYFAENRQRHIPFAILLEIALQPCGFLAAYVGSGLTSDKDLHFRNLGGDAVLLKELTAGDYTLTVDAALTAVAASGGMVIQHFTFKVYRENELIYDGKTYFGFFSDAALAEQVGIREAKIYELTAAEEQIKEQFPLLTTASMPTATWQMVRDVTVWLPEGGPHKKGFIRGTIPVEPDRWFFKAHFYEDPVWPGSLGLEAFLQLLKTALLKKTGRTQGEFSTIMTGAKHEWLYRGQVIPRDSLVTVEASIKEFDAEKGLIKADGFLSVDGRHIYQMTDFVLTID
jgi:3-hydroxymyristoyl/3-hydroxydecanoyl-(acyl carrier protein) dehydratase